MTETLTSKRLIFDGVPLLQITLRLPSTGSERLLTFLQELAEGAKNWCATTLFDALAAEYSADTDPRRRFHHRSLYELDIRVLSDSESCVELLISATLKTRDGHIEQQRTINFDPSNGYILPPRKNRTN